MLTVLVSLLTTSAHASDDVALLPAFTESDAAAAKEKSGKKKDGDGKGKGKGKNKEEEDEGMGGKLLGFNWEPYVTPGGGVQIDASGGTAITAGADVGIKYWKKKFDGNLYLGGTYLTGDGISGYDVHLGNTAAYRVKYWGAGGGLEVAYNGQTNTNTGKDILAPALGVLVPVEIVVGPKKFYGKAGVTPAWYFNEDRKPAAGTVPLGDEFEWHAGVGLKLGQFKGELGFAQLITSAGTYNTPTINVGWNP